MRTTVILEESPNYLNALADELDSATRQGRPGTGTEGGQYVIMSDELAKQIAVNLRYCAQEYNQKL